MEKLSTNHVIIIMLLVLLIIWQLSYKKIDSFDSQNTTSALPPQINSLSAINGNILNIKTNDDIKNLMINGTFRLKVNLPNVWPYTPNPPDSLPINPNYFYLSIIKPDTNCSIIGLNNSILDMYVDGGECKNKKLSMTSQNSPYRLVLIPEAYALDEKLPYIDNINFSLMSIYNRHYLKNTTTGYFPTLYKDDYKIPVHGYMINDNKSNIKTIPNLVNNVVIKDSEKPINLNNSKLYVDCQIEPNNKTYLLTTKDIHNASPVDININQDNTINISLRKYDSYGNIEDTFALVYCNFDIETGKDIVSFSPSGKISTFINMVCFASNKEDMSKSNKLDFIIENVSLPSPFAKKASIL